MNLPYRLSESSFTQSTCAARASEHGSLLRHVQRTACHGYHLGTPPLPGQERGGGSRHERVASSQGDLI